MEKKLAGGKTTTNPALLKDLYRMYYRETWRIARVTLTILSVICFFMALYFYTMGFGNIYTVIALWLGLLFVIYPRNAYRRPYKQSKDEKSTVFFSFYEDGFKEKTDGSSQLYKYADIYSVTETPKYFYFFHTKKDVSVLDKAGINNGSAEQIASLLKTKAAKYKKLKQD